MKIDLKFHLVIIAFIAIIFFAFDGHASAGNNVKTQPETSSSANLDAKYLAKMFITRNSGQYVFQDCSKYPGFINKIVQCVTNVITKERYFKKLVVMNTKFAGITNAALILYIMIFGLRLSLNVIENVKAEIFIVIITCFFLTYVNNTYRIKNFIGFFIGLQNEFASVASAAVYNSPNADKSVCYGYEVNGKMQKFTVWQRMDCLVAYVIGIHPVVEYVGQYYDDKNTSECSQESSNLIPGICNIDHKNKKFDYGLFATNNNPFANMAEDPYCFLTFRLDPSIITSATDVETVKNTAKDLIKNSENKCLEKYTKMTAEDFTKLKMAVNNDKYESTVTFSLVVIIVGMLLGNSAIGLSVFILGVFVILIMFAAFGQAALVYITSLFAILVLGLFAPLILPCFLFKQTRQIFDTWIQLLLAYCLQTGLVICYISFMISVIQYVISYKASINEGNKNSLLDYNFSDLYKKADISQKPAVTVVQKTSANNNSILYSDLGGINESYQGSLINKTDAEFAVVADEETNSRKDSFTSEFGLQRAGIDMQTFNVPSFRFFSQGLMNSVVSTFANYDPFNSDLEKSAANANNTNNTQMGDRKLKITQEQEEFRLNIAYLQVLLMVFLTFAITFSFMSNVMEFAGRLAGIGVSPVVRGANLYSMVNTKLGNFLGK
jgi:type IV secretory pathway VirB6-like protein